VGQGLTGAVEQVAASEPTSSVSEVPCKHLALCVIITPTLLPVPYFFILSSLFYVAPTPPAA